jgi:glycosyltransferase involved in cell wall biosynthesis
LASRVPLVCTPHGTRAFAEHEVTALVIEQATPAAILAAIGRLRADADQIASNGQARIAQFSWDAYAAGLLEILMAHDSASGTLQ